MSIDLNQQKPPVGKQDAAPSAIRWLSYFNWLLAALVLLPCCFVVYSPFLFNAVLCLNLRRLAENTPDRADLHPRDMILVPGGLVYVLQVVVLAAPMVAAAITLRRSPRTGWSLSLIVVLLQFVLLVANLVAVLTHGELAWVALGLLPTIGLFASEATLLVANCVLLRWSSNALTLAADRR